MEPGLPRIPDEALTCLAELAAVSGELHRQISQFSQWAIAVNQQAPGMTYAETLPLDKRVAMTEQISEAIKALSRDGNKFRRLEARALYEEGLTMAQLAAIFGVSRQRVSTLLREGGRHNGELADD
jgi:DNA-directed RNA polymerase specialized sigma subunit